MEAARARLIVDPPLGACSNMARDETLLGSVIDGGSPALRFYRWAPAAISLGYFQPIDAWEQHREALERFDLVRRPTGGGAILHHDELTYSIATPESLPALGGSPVQLYQLAHEAIRDALGTLGARVDFHTGCCEGNSQRGPFFCFARRHRYDLTADGQKIVGSAQRRRGGAILQHGSIILRRVAPQPCIGASNVAPAPIEADRLIEALGATLGSRLELELRGDEWVKGELRNAGKIEQRYRSDAWTRKR
jgi:lipoate-protein ligase A